MKKTICFYPTPKLIVAFNAYYRSAATGKINESIEMFTCRDSLLAPLKPVTHFDADDAQEATNNDNSTKNLTALPTAEESAADNSTKTNTTTGGGNTANGGKASHNQRLITFDSTDPEFDEDSDPDADLDL